MMTFIKSENSNISLSSIIVTLICEICFSSRICVFAVWGSVGGPACWVMQRRHWYSAPPGWGLSSSHHFWKCVSIISLSMFFFLFLRMLIPGHTASASLHSLLTFSYTIQSFCFCVIFLLSPRRVCGSGHSTQLIVSILLLSCLLG